MTLFLAISAETEEGDNPKVVEGPLLCRTHCCIRQFVLSLPLLPGVSLCPLPSIVEAKLEVCSLLSVSSLLSFQQCRLSPCPHGAEGFCGRRKMLAQLCYLFLPGVGFSRLPEFSFFLSATLSLYMGTERLQTASGTRPWDLFLPLPGSTACSLLILVKQV